MDDDLQAFDRESLVAEVKKLRAGIRAHRDTTGHDLCWHHPDLWDLLPEKTEPSIAVPPWPKFTRLHPVPPVARQAGARRACA
jgi:hypothetical protein